MPIHDLSGCAPAPLGHYLKALGILRLVAEQADPTARGWWEGGLFRLMTMPSQEDLEAFFLERYEPTPLASPWNRGSGYFYENDPGLTPAENATATRFRRLSQGIKAGRSLLTTLGDANAAVSAVKGETKVTKEDRDKIRAQLGVSEKPSAPQSKELKRHVSRLQAEKKQLRESEEYKKRLAETERRFKSLKADLIPQLRMTWRGPHRDWMDAALVIDSDGHAKWPSLLGTGGADGRLDFTNNFFQRLNEVFDLADLAGSPRLAAGQWLSGSLWGNAIPGCQAGNAVGQYLPGSAGGANNGNRPDADSQLNPVDLLLMLEGSILFTVNATRRLGATENARSAAPFAVGAQGAGYASAADSDEGARGEQWMPLWSQPVTLAELRRLLSEVRAQIGAKPAREPFDLARAVARLGTARGISAFQRYGYIQRNGQSNLAIPLGRFVVPLHVFPRLACLDDLDAWLPRLRRQARDRHAPARLRLSERRLGDALFAVAQHPTEPDRWQSVLLALADVEAVQVTGSGFQAGPIPRFRPEWVSAADNGAAELRLALACAMQAIVFTREGKATDPVRRHWLPLDRGRYATTGTGAQTRLEVGPDVVLGGRNGVADAVALVERRLIDGTHKGKRNLPLDAAYRAAAAPADLAALVAGALDLDRAMALARAMMAIDRRQWASRPCPPQPASAGSYPDDAWLTVRLALLPWPLKSREGRETPIGTGPAIFRRLASGDAAGAATFQTPSGRALLVESAQSMANRRELTCWDDARQDLKSSVEGLSHVRVLRNGHFLTDTVLEAHRLNSPYLLQSSDRSFFDRLKSELGGLEAGPIDRKKLAETLLKFDIGSLLHGIFIAKKELAGGRLRVARAMAAFIEADNVEIAPSGGVKNDHVNPSGDTKIGFGNVPFARDELTAQHITLYVNLDLAQIRGYGLGTDVEKLSILLALYKLRALVDGSLRLRTACDFRVTSDSIPAKLPSNFALPSLGDINQALRPAIDACSDRMTVEKVSFDDELKKGKEEKAPETDEAENAEA